ncbi:MAG TPA: ABC transporter substrate-binding protein [Actinocrinis sp.]|jgi:peptide/nickel transport system substrate-binding protein
MSRSRTTKAIAVVAALCLGAAACSSSGKSSTAASTADLVLEDNNGATAYTNNFNPFDSGDFVLTENTASFIYEPLFQFNTLNSSQAPIPWLASSYSWSDGNTTLTIDLRNNVKWTDGTTFTSADVAFTFNAIAKTQAANQFGVPTASSITTPDANTVVLKYASPQAANFLAIGEQLIVQKAQWSKYANIATQVVPGASAIGTGPYVLNHFSPQDVTYKANSGFWGGAPKVQGISVPLYTNANSATLALSSGKIDLAGNDINDVVTTFVDKNPSQYHLYESQAPYFPASNTVALMLNSNDSNSPFLADPDVRKAISAALDRSQLAAQGETNYELPASSAGGLTLPIDNSSLDPKVAKDISPTAQQSTVQQLMTADGFTMGANNQWTKNGQTVKFIIIDPNSFGDYWSDAQLMQTQLNSAGFNVSVNGAFTYTTWTQAITTGNFDAALHWGQGNTPFQRLQFIMDNTQTAPEGQTAAGDYDRYNSTTAAAAVTAYESATTSSAQQSALDQMQEVFANDMPAIPVLYGAAWYEYSTANFTGWPDASNAYINPSPNNQAYEYLVLKLQPVS